MLGRTGLDATYHKRLTTSKSTLNNNRNQLYIFMLFHLINKGKKYKGVWWLSFKSDNKSDLLSV